MYVCIRTYVCIYVCVRERVCVCINTSRALLLCQCVLYLISKTATDCKRSQEFVRAVKKSICGEDFISRTHELCLLTLLTLLTLINLLTNLTLLNLLTNSRYSRYFINLLNLLNLLYIYICIHMNINTSRASLLCRSGLYNKQL